MLQRIPLNFLCVVLTKYTKAIDEFVADWRRNERLAKPWRKPERNSDRLELKRNNDLAKVHLVIVPRIQQFLQSAKLRF